MAVAMMDRLELTQAERLICIDRLVEDVMGDQESVEAIERRVAREVCTCDKLYKPARMHIHLALALAPPSLPSLPPSLALFHANAHLQVQRVRTRQSDLIAEGPKTDWDQEVLDCVPGCVCTRSKFTFSLALALVLALTCTCIRTRTRIHKHTQVDVVEVPEDELGDLTPEERALLEARRSAEFDLVSRHDKTEIDLRTDCWFLVDTNWLSQWAKYMEGKGEPPDKISNLNLYQLDGRTIRRRLLPKKDYRGVRAVIWYIFVELYGKDDAPEICRYSMNIYDPGVVGKDRLNCTKAHGMKARVEVSRMNADLMDSSEEEEEDDPHLCLCFTKEHLECCLYHIFTGCQHLGRRGPRYKKLAFDDEIDSSDEDEEHLGESRKARRKRLQKKKGRARERARKVSHSSGGRPLGRVCTFVVRVPSPLPLIPLQERARVRQQAQEDMRNGRHYVDRLSKFGKSIELV